MKSFIKFHEENPKIYEEFQKIACIYIARDKVRIKADMICEIIRFQLMKDYNDAYKFINSFPQDYAKKFENDFPQHVGIFTKRLVNFELDD
jgi:hypothetical protein